METATAIPRRSRGGQLKHLLILSVLAVVASCGKSDKSEARPGSGTSVTAGACAYSIDNGCAAANRNGMFQNASLLTSAQQSGQNSLLPTHPMAFNIPAVDYPVGPDKTLTPRDPRTINDRICHYVPSPPASAEVVECDGSGVLNYTINNYDFSGTKIGKAPVLLYFDTQASPGSVMTITNSYFSVPRIDSKSIGFHGNWSIIFKNNQCDGTSAVRDVSQFCFGDDGDSVGTTFVAEYNAFTNMNVGRVAGGFRYMTTAWRYNFIQGLNDLLTANHGEVALRTCSQNNCTSSEEYNGNFIIWNSTPAGSVNNATFFPSTGASNRLRFTSVKIINNISVNNLGRDGSLQVGNGLFDFRAANYGDVTITGNWLDSAGQGNCGISGASSGGNSVTASQSGNIVNVTGLSSSFGTSIEPGYMFFHAGGYTTTTITAFGTAFGSTGTYTVDGPPQTVASDGAWTLVPGFKSQTLGGNYLLNDPRHTGVPTAIGYTGPQFSPTNCF